ncbi:MAG TPA: hypothetical protein VFK32_10300 [Tepidiformaceae bacterium]|nr:hypothetical protein [Tepidiformaceae bacterium]
MIEDEAGLRSLLRIDPTARLDVEDLSTPWASITHLTATDPPLNVVLKRAVDPEAAYTELAVLEAFGRIGFSAAPHLRAIHGDAAVLEWVDGAPATALVPPAGAVDAAVDALAALHSLSIAEGVHWGSPPEAVVEWAPLPLHRLGFSADERDAADPPIGEAFELLRAAHWGMTHGDATAANVLLRPGGATFTGWGRAGYGPSLFDLSAFLLTAGIPAAERAAAVRRYARARSLDEDTLVAEADLLGILWGLDWLLPLPRRQIVVMGDDAATSLLVLLANRIERAIKEPAGHHPLAARIRRALWP